MTAMNSYSFNDYTWGLWSFVFGNMVKKLKYWYYKNSGKFYDHERLFRQIVTLNHIANLNRFELFLIVLSLFFS